MELRVEAHLAEAVPIAGARAPVIELRVVGRDGVLARQRLRMVLSPGGAPAASRISFVREGAPTALGGVDLELVRAYWRERLGVGPWLGEALYLDWVRRFVREVVVEDPEALAHVRGRGCIFVANHQVAVESLLFSVVGPTLGGVPVAALAKAEHRASWLGLLSARFFSHPGVTDPGLLVFFDRADPASLPRILGELAAGLREGRRSLLVHVDGTRAAAARTPVARCSSALLDLAIATGAPVVPLRFAGGLPVRDDGERFEFPAGYGAQSWHVGAPIEAHELAGLALRERSRRVLDALNSLGPALDLEEPAAPDARFGAAVDAWIARGASPPHGAVLASLEALAPTDEDARAVLRSVHGGVPHTDGDARERWLAHFARSLYEG